jgi:phage protein D
MQLENFYIYIEIDSEEAADIYSDLISLEVELDDQLVSMFRMRLPLKQEQDSTWSYLDDERFSIWKPVLISAGFEGGTEDIISGYITHVRPSFEPHPSHGILEIWGMDESVLMDREEKLKDWPNKKDSDIATEIFNSHGFTPEVEDTGVVYDEAVATIIQRETDMQFLNRLALRSGFECFVEGATAYFRAPQLDDPPQPVLACHFGGETNLERFSVEVNALTPSRVNMFQVDPVNKEILDAAVESSEQTALGGSNADSYLPAGTDPGRVYISMNAATGTSEMETLCRSFFHSAEWFVTAEGETKPNIYNHVLKPRATVTVKGVGETHSGVYYVSHVTHSIVGSQYIQFFKAKRNGLMLTGSEDFSASSGLLGGLL